MSHGRGRGQIAALTAFRGIAALMVVVYHYSGGFLPALEPDLYTRLVSKGYLWVDFFFILSGFVLAHSYGAEFREGLRADTLRAFVFARFARIYPLHLAILAGFLALELCRLGLRESGVVEFASPPFEGAKSVPAFASNLALAQTTGIHDRLTWNGPAWSIGAEWLVYLAFPLLALIVLRVPPLLGAGLVTGAFVGLGALSDWGASLDVTYDYGLWRCGFGVVIGAMLHRFLGTATRMRLGSDVVSVGLLGALLWTLHVGASDLWAPPLLALLVLSLAANEGLVTKSLARPWLLWLGAASYAIYLSHMLVLETTATVARVALGEPIGRRLDAQESILLMAALVMVVLALSATLRRYVETPAQATLKGSRWARRHIYREARAPRDEDRQAR